jgi:hypothetical protein
MKLYIFILGNNLGFSTNARGKNGLRGAAKKKIKFPLPHFEKRGRGNFLETGEFHSYQHVGFN